MRRAKALLPVVKTSLDGQLIESQIPCKFCGRFYKLDRR